jgi:branched-chain amino acid transport system substrate-binding protein
MRFRTLSLPSAALWIAALAAPLAVAQKKYDPGATDTEIKIGNIMPYTGAFSEYGSTGRAEAAYFQMINERGGVNGRKIEFLSVDSGSDTEKAIALARQLVDRDQVLFTAGNWGTPANLAIRAYMNEKKVPQLFVAATESAFDDPSHYPWTMGFQPTKRTEGLVYARYVRENRPGAKIAILYSKDDSGDEWLQAIRDGLGEKSSARIVKEVSFDYSDPEGLDAQIAILKDSGADVFMNLAVGRFATRPFARHTRSVGIRCSSFRMPPSRWPRFWNPRALRSRKESSRMRVRKTGSGRNRKAIQRCGLSWVG